MIVGVPDYPIYLCDNPAASGNPLSPALTARLVEAFPSLVGIKDSSGSLDKLAAATRWREGTFNTASGSDGMVLAAGAIGVDACVSGYANVVPELVVELHRAVRCHDLERARTLQMTLNEVRTVLRDGADLSLFKAMLSRRGLAVGAVRPPLLQASEEAIAACWQALNTLGVDLSPI